MTLEKMRNLVETDTCTSSLTLKWFQVFAWMCKVMIILSGTQVCSTVFANCGKRWYLSILDILKFQYHSYLQQWALPLSFLSQNIFELLLRAMHCSRCQYLLGTQQYKSLHLICCFCHINIGKGSTTFFFFFQTISSVKTSMERRLQMLQMWKSFFFSLINILSFKKKKWNNCITLILWAT